MKEYYKKRIESVEVQLKLCKIGFIEEMCAMGERLLESRDINIALVEVDDINEMKSAIDDLEQDLASASEQLQKELDKESK